MDSDNDVVRCTINRLGLYSQLTAVHAWLPYTFCDTVAHTLPSAFAFGDIRGRGLWAGKDEVPRRSPMGAMDRKTIQENATRRRSRPQLTLPVKPRLSARGKDLKEFKEGQEGESDRESDEEDDSAEIFVGGEGNGCAQRTETDIRHEEGTGRVEGKTMQSCSSVSSGFIYKGLDDSVFERSHGGCEEAVHRRSGGSGCENNDRYEQKTTFSIRSSDGTRTPPHQRV